MPLMELVEDDGLDTGQGRVMDQLPQEHPLGRVADAGVRRCAVFQADLVSNLLPESALALLGHPLG